MRKATEPQMRFWIALQKALYYIQGFYYAFYKEFLFAENCQA